MSKGLISTTKELRTELSILYENVKKGHTRACYAKQMVNMAGKMINSAKLDFEYTVMKTKIPDMKIDFLE